MTREELVVFLHKGRMFTGPYGEAADLLVQDGETIQRLDRAVDAAVSALDRLAKRGSLHRDVREETIRLLVEARNQRLDT